MKLAIFDFNRTLFDPEKQELFPGVERLLYFFVATGWKLALISINAPEREPFVKKIRYYFDVVKLVEKKDEKIFLEVAAELSADPTTIVVIGDRIKEEIRIGNKLGMTTIWIQQGEYSTELPDGQEENPKFIFENINELTNFLNQNRLGGNRS